MAAQTKIRLSSSMQGTADSIVVNLFWLIAAIIAAFWTWGSLQATIASFSAEIGEQLGFWSTLRHRQFTGAENELWLGGRGVLLMLQCLIIFGAFWDLMQCFYRAKTRTLLDLEAKTFTEWAVGFPFRRGELNVRFDRIVGISVRQNSLERIFNIGSIELTYLRNENFESVRADWTIPFLTDPLGKKRHLEHLLSQGGTEAMQVVRKG